MSRVTPNSITQLEEDEVFVFGSNEAGRHGKGAAKTAMKWGAVYGQAEGLQDNTYAIPTVNFNIKGKLPLIQINRHVKKFIKFAKENKDKKFLVTEIGCGLAGWEVKNVAPLFEEALNVSNIYLPKRFIECIINMNTLLKRTTSKLYDILQLSKESVCIVANLHKDKKVDASEFLRELENSDIKVTIDEDVLKEMIERDTIVMMIVGQDVVRCHYDVDHLIDELYYELMSEVLYN